MGDSNASLSCRSARKPFTRAEDRKRSTVGSTPAE
jgi:hypothetical protein